MNLLEKTEEVRKESNFGNIQATVPREIDNIQTNLKTIPNSSNFSISMLASLINSRNAL